MDTPSASHVIKDTDRRWRSRVEAGVHVVERIKMRREALTTVYTCEMTDLPIPRMEVAFQKPRPLKS